MRKLMPLLALLIFVLAFVVRIAPLHAYHGWDESVYLQHAENIYSGKDNYDEFRFRPPVLPLLFAAGFFVWHSTYMASVIIALLSAAMVIGLYLVGKRLHSEEAGLFAALIGALHPTFVTFGHLLLTDALVASFLVFALYFALQERWWEFFLAGIFTALGALTKFTGLAAIPLIFLLIAWMQWKKLRITSLVLYSVGVFIGLLPYLIWAQMKYGNFLLVFQRAQAIVNNVHGGPLYYLSLALFTIPLLLGLVLLIWKWKKEYLPFTVFSSLWLILILGYLNTFPNKDMRYGLIAVMPLIILAGIGYAQAKRVHRHAILVSIFLIIIFSLNAFAGLTQPFFNYWKPAPVEMAHEIAALGNTSMIIYATSDYPVYGYYTNNKVVVVDGPDFLRAYPLIMPRDGYLLVYKNRTREPTVSWADNQPELKSLKENDAIILYQYTKKRR